MLNNILYSHTHKMLLRIRGLLNADLMPPVEVKTNEQTKHVFNHCFVM